MNNLYGLLIIIAIVVLLMYRSRSENFKCKHYNPGDISHCPRACTPFLYPDMYSPHSSCSDPLNWGITYSTGRCPVPYQPFPRRFPSPAGGVHPPPNAPAALSALRMTERGEASPEKFGDPDEPWFTHGAGASYDDPKHTTSTSYGYNYS